MKGKILAGVVLFMLWRMATNGDTTEATHVRTGSRIDAFVMSKQFVERRLRAPRTASFPSITNDEVLIDDLGAGRWRVRAYVDAQNAFGGEVRTRYKCVMRTADGETWIPEVVELY